MTDATQDSTQTGTQEAEYIEPSSPQQEPVLETIDTDAELLEIFLEEAQEIDEQIATDFAQWQQNPTQTDVLATLQRHLHTIKGGARMAGINSIGDLTHEAETVYEQFIKRRLTPNPAWVQVMQLVQDTLSQQIDYISAQNKSFFAHGLVEQLKSLVADPEAIKDYAASLQIPLSQDAPVDAVHSPSDALLKPATSMPAIGDETLATSSDQSLSPLQTSSNLNGLSSSTTSSQSIDDTLPPLGQLGIEFEFRRLKASSWAQQPLPDDDILQVFLEEADEVNQQIHTNFEQVLEGLTHFEEGIDNSAIQHRLFAQLQRSMHTLKAGARMVYASGLADITYQLETTYARLAEQRLILSAGLTQLLSLANDWLEDAIKLLRGGINPPRPNDLLAALQQSLQAPTEPLHLPDVSLQNYLAAVDKFEEWKRTHIGQHDITEPPIQQPVIQKDSTATSSNEMTRVSASLMEQMITLSGESAINRTRIDMNVGSIEKSIEEMGRTVQRLSDQLRRMDIELEAQILSQLDEAQLDAAQLEQGFDPLEMDQYSSLNQLSKSLSESASDLLDIKTTILEKTHDAEDLLRQLSRTQTELQDGLMSSRMVPFARLWPRLKRVVRQTANELNKQVLLDIANTDDDIDRTILERITAPLEHMLRNAVDHGIEDVATRTEMGKSQTGHIELNISRSGSELLITLKDDGRGINVDAVRQKAISRGLIDENDTSLTDLDVMQYIFSAGLTTTNKVTQISGRGVGMDVVLSDIRKLGGTVSVDSTPDVGTEFSVRVPLSVALTDAMIVRVADKRYAIPLIQIERVERVTPQALQNYYQSNQNTFNINETEYRLRYLNEMLTGTRLSASTVKNHISLPVIIVKNQSGQNLAIQVDEVVGSRIEVVVKPLGQQLSHIAGLSAATIMGDGSVMLILDILALHRHAPARASYLIGKPTKTKFNKTTKTTPQVLIVDDSVTVRKVTSRLLERRGFETHVARDGVEALEILQELKPDVMLLDIEMPRMDGFEVASHIRHDALLKALPIIMITSRTGDKHRKRAEEIGVNEYMGKPFQEQALLERVCEVIGISVDSIDNDEGN